MKTVYTLLIVFAFLLFKGTNSLQAQVIQNVDAYTAKTVLHQAAAERANPTDLTILQKIIPANKLVDDYNFENEEEDGLSLDRYVSVLVTMVCLSCALAVFDQGKQHLPNCSHFSYTASSIYLRQRALRI